MLRTTLLADVPSFFEQTNKVQVILFELRFCMRCIQHCPVFDLVLKRFQLMVHISLQILLFCNQKRGTLLSSRLLVFYTLHIFLKLYTGSTPSSSRDVVVQGRGKSGGRHGRGHEEGPRVRPRGRQVQSRFCPRALFAPSPLLPRVVPAGWGG